MGIGSEHPIRIQTMTTTDTKDVAATVEQVFNLSFLSRSFTLAILILFSSKFKFVHIVF